MRKLQGKQKIMFSISLTFLLTSFSANIFKTITDLKNISLYEHANDEIINFKKLKSNEEEIKSKILELVETIGEAMNYIENNVSDTKLTKEVNLITEDCIDAIQIIDNNINKLNKNDVNNLNKQTKILSTYINEIKLSLKEGDLQKRNDIVSYTRREYKCWKKEKII